MGEEQALQAPPQEHHAAGGGHVGLKTGFGPALPAKSTLGTRTVSLTVLEVPLPRLGLPPEDVAGPQPAP